MGGRFTYCFILAIGFVFGAAVAEAQSKMPVVKISPEAPQSGKNKVTIELPAAVAAETESLKIIFYMPAMGSMPYMEATGEVEEEGPGKYAGKFELAMGGSWEVKLTLSGKQGTKDYYYALTTGVPGLVDRNPAESDTMESQDHSPSDAPALVIGSDRLQRIGVRHEKAVMKSLEKIIRAPGVIEGDKSSYADVTVRVQGYVEKQYVSRSGDLVKAGDPLISIYSPEFVAVQSEMLVSRATDKTTHSLHRLSVERLINLGMSEADIKLLQKRNTPLRSIDIRAPISGTVTNIYVLEGGTVQPGQIIYTIGDLSKNYIVARIFQQDIPDITVGQSVDVHLDASDEVLKARVDLIYPTINNLGTGTVNVRVVLAESKKILKPGTYADLRFHSVFEPTVIVAESAVVYSGLHEYVFINLGGGRLEPREVKTGRRHSGYVQIIRGVKDGESVVTSGNFLLSSEAQLRTALPKWKNETGHDSEGHEK